MNIYQPDTRIRNFLCYLRNEGYTVGIQETLDALELMDSFRQPDLIQSRRVLRALTCQDRQEWQQFDRLFEHFWFPENLTDEKSTANIVRNPRRTALTGLSGASEEDVYKNAENAGQLSSGAGRHKTISQADFRFLGDRRAAREIELLAENLAKTLRKKFQRRRQISHHGRKLDIRRTIRKSMNHGGMPIRRMFSHRKQEPLDLLVLHDVSHSMTWNNPLLFRFVRGIMKTFPSSEAFAFHTELFCVSSLYRERSLETMRNKLERNNYLWMGGTCIADSLATFNKIWAKDKIRKRTIVIIISDGFDTNAPENLEQQLQQLRKQCRKIIWMNPMLGREGFLPDETFLQYTQEHIDRFAPAHSLESLQQVIHLLANSS